MSEFIEIILLLFAIFYVYSYDKFRPIFPSPNENTSITVIAAIISII